MGKTRSIFFVFLGAFGLIAGLSTSSVFGVEKDTTTIVTKSAKINVNKATEQELQELPGIGEVYAKKIIAGRPYKTQADLVKAGIPQNAIDKIKDKITFGKEKTAKHHIKKDSTTTSATKRHNDTSDVTPQIPPRKGMVWVNKETMVYHTEGDHWYGNTKNGEFMDEKDAIKFGAHRSKQD